MAVLDLSFDRCPGELSVREFRVRERFSRCFEIEAVAQSADPSLALGAILGTEGSFRAAPGYRFVANGGERVWAGLCSKAEQIAQERAGASTYRFTLVPRLWLLGQRRTRRAFVHLSASDIADEVFDEWRIERVWHVERGAYPIRELTVQYDETDLEFLSRILADVGIGFVFDGEIGRDRVVLGDRFTSGPLRPGPPLVAVDEPDLAAEREYVTDLRLAQAASVAEYVLTDADLRRPHYDLRLATRADRDSRPASVHAFRPGASLAGGSGGYLHREDVGQFLAVRALEAARARRSSVTFRTNVSDLAPGRMFAVSGELHPAISRSGGRLLATELEISGSPTDEWSVTAAAVPADEPYRPEQTRAVPRVRSLQSGTVTGPPGGAVHVDDVGRVQVRFHWDRAGRVDHQRSCWVRVSDAAAGTAFGTARLPRIGQEVLLAFEDGHPDRPVVVGRLSNLTQPTPYDLPERRATSSWKTESSPGASGHNEISMDDDAGKELLRIRAERDARTLVIHDETTTVVHDRVKTVVLNEIETTLGDRIQTTKGKRSEGSGQARTSVTRGAQRSSVERDREISLGADSTSRVERDHHAHVERDRRENIQGSHQATVGGAVHQEVVGVDSLQTFSSSVKATLAAVDAGDDLHVRAGHVVLDGADISVNGAGSFVRVDAGGVTIKGPLVRINEGGSPNTYVPAQFVAPTRSEEPVPLQATDLKFAIVEIEPVGRNGPIVVGERVKLKVVCSDGRALPDASWSVSGSKLGDYRQRIEYVGDGNSTRATSSDAKITFFLHPDPGVKPGDSAHDTAGQEVAFYWIEKGIHTVTVSLGGKVVASKDFTVEAPTFSVTVETGKVFVSPDAKSNLFLRCGHPDSKPGVLYIYEVTAPARGDGEIAAVVLLKSHRKLSFDDGSVDCSATGRVALERWLDAFLPTDRQAPLKQRQVFSATTPVDAAGGKKAIWTLDDSPDHQLGKMKGDPRTPTRLEVEEDFDVFFMYRPSGLDGLRKPDAQSIWVTMARYAWRWTAAVDPMTGAFIVPPTHPFFAPYLVVPTSVPPTWERVLPRDHQDEPCLH